MSDTDDGFDREAVREELREKYENEQEDREATARMSELLLQGATMTNDHCDRCGTPIFRYDGQAFCPNCQHEAEQQAQEQQSAQQAQDGAQAQGQQAPEQGGQQPAQSDDAASEPDHRQPPAPEQTDDHRQPESQPSPQARDLPEHAPTASTPGANTPGEAADALESTIAALSRRAASADDPRTAREYLEAAREAAEALAALR